MSRFDTMRKLRISAISFLNTAPLMWDFEHGMPPRGETPGPTEPQTASPLIGGGEASTASWQRHFEIEYTIPSLCAAALSAGTADIGIVPVAACASIPGLMIVPEVAIAAKGPVRSILLVSRLPLERIRTLAADTSSRTSVALARVWFHRCLGRAPEFVPMAPPLETMLARCDAALLIGDPALRVDRSRYPAWDLAEEWRRFTGQPFVFAFWAVRAAALAEASPELDVAAVFQNSCRRGLEPDHIAAIARAWSPVVGLDEADIRDYLLHNIHYRLDGPCRSGMELFFRYAVECGALPAPPPFRFLGTAHLSKGAP